MALLIVFGCAGLAHAEDTRTSPWRVAASSFFYGPPVADPASSETAAPYEGATQGLSVQNQVGLGYDFSPEWQLMPVIDFEYRLSDPAQPGAGGSVALTYDSFLKLYGAGLAAGRIGESRAWLDFEARFFVPTSEYSQANGTLGSIRAGVNPGVALGRGGFALSAVTFARYFLQTRDQAAGGASTDGLPLLTLYGGPQLSYSFSEQVTIWALFESAYAKDTRGASNFDDPKISVADLEPGLAWRVNPWFSLTPYLNWYLQRPLETVSLNLIATVSL